MKKLELKVTNIRNFCLKNSGISGLGKNGISGNPEIGISGNPEIGISGIAITIIQKSRSHHRELTAQEQPEIEFFGK
jgi:hypothetical protein